MEWPQVWINCWNPHPPKNKRERKWISCIFLFLQTGTSPTTSVVPANVRDVATPQSVVLSNTASSSSYHRNIKTHVGRPSLGFKKLFPCRFCSKQFPFRSYLIRHERAHTGERPFQCTTCGKGFSREWIRKSHARCCRKWSLQMFILVFACKCIRIFWKLLGLQKYFFQRPVTLNINKWTKFCYTCKNYGKTERRHTFISIETLTKVCRSIFV